MIDRMDEAIVDNGLSSLRLMSKIKWALIIFVVTWGSYLPGPTLFGFTLYPLRIFVLIYLLVAVFLKTGKFQLKLHGQNVSLFVIALCGIVTILWSVDRKESFSNLIVLVTDIIIFFMAKKMMKCERDYIDAGFGLRLNMYIIAGLAIMESVTGQYMYEAAYAWMYRDVNIFGLREPKVVFYNVNNLASYFALCFPIACDSLRNVNKSFVKKIIITAISTIVIVLTNARGGMLAILLSIIIMVFIGNEGDSRLKNSRAKKIFIGLVVISSIIYFAPNIQYILTDAGQKIDIRTEGRWKIWADLLMMAANNAFIGHGLGTCQIMYFAAHNIWLAVLFELGLVGFVAFAYFIFSIILKNYRHSVYKGLLLSCFVSLLICGFSESSLFLTYYLWLLYGLWSERQIDGIKEKGTYA